ncbi:MAG: DUF4190 domain-containing protein [Bacteroidales bacterium]|nr:DUF4190 domain-containing protein [Bacteroidales bacterium]
MKNNNRFNNSVHVIAAGAAKRDAGVGGKDNTMTEGSFSYRLGQKFGERDRKHRAAVAATKATYASALEEIEQGNQDKGLWAKALAECDGNTDRAKATYIRFKHQEKRGQLPSLSVGRKTGLALSSLICGILGGWASTLSIPAVICGHMALSRANKEPDVYGGKGMAIAGLVLGYLGLVLAIILGTMRGILRVQLHNMGY